METHDLDSILDECLGAGIPNVELTWHYRSRHESLIAFSNQAYYGGRLVTFPSPVTRDDAVSFRHVPDGVYARGGARTNEREAKAVVAEALAVLRAPEARSLGIVTFNAQQQALIEDLFDKARRDDISPTVRQSQSWLKTWKASRGRSATSCCSRSPTAQMRRDASR